MSTVGQKDLEVALDDPSPNSLHITPLLDRKQIGRGAIDLRLGTEFLLLRRTRHPGLDPAKFGQEEIDETQERVVVPFGGRLWLHPRHFILSATLEYLAIHDDMAASVVGRSSWGRVGLLVATAIFVHPGFRGCLTLELVNEGDAPICLSPGARIAQLELRRLENPAPSEGSERRKYVAPVRPQVSRLPMERAELRRLKSLDRELKSRLGR